MKPVLIGSRALAYWKPELKLNASTDWDVISDTPIEGTEWHDPSFLNNREMALTFASPNTTIHNNIEYQIMSLEGLAIIKRSHLWRDYKFQSHITQYHKYGLHDLFFLISHKPCRHERYYKLYIDRLQLTHKAFPREHPKLNKSSDDFFNDAVTRKYDHDMLHELVAYYDKPLYTQLLVSPDTVACSVDKWNAFLAEDKLKCIAEEVVVTALERFVIPDTTYPYKLAYIKSLDKVCTTMCSGWFRDFAIDNYPHITNLYDPTRFTKILTQLGEIK